MTEELKAKLRKAADEADMIQNGCNLSGIAHAFSRMLTDVLWPAARELNQGTDWVNQHPICVLFIDKMSSLARSQDNDMIVFRAFDACKRIAAGESESWSGEEVVRNAGA